jgi:ELWxxDGT repeat protein
MARLLVRTKSPLLVVPLEASRSSMAKCFFTSNDSNLWVTNGTAAGTHELTGITGAAASGFDPGGFTVFKNQVLFTATDVAGVRGLWVTNGTVAGTHELTGIKGAYSGGLEPSTSFTIFGNEVLFGG